MSRRRPRLSECKTMPDLVRGGFAQAFGPSSESGYLSYGAGRLSLPALVNYCTNPSLETGAAAAVPTGWAENCNAAASPTYSKAPGRVSGIARRITYASASDSSKRTGLDFYVAAGGGFAATDPCVFSLWLKTGETHSGTIAATIYIQGYAAGAYVDAVSAVIASPLPGVWTRYTVKVAALSATVDNIHTCIWFTGIDAGETLDAVIDDACITKTTWTPDYFDGSYSGRAWSAAAHASTSTSLVSAMRADPPNSGPSGMGSAGTIACRFSPAWAGTDTTQRILADLAQDSDKHRVVLGWHPAAYWQVAVIDTGTSRAQSPGAHTFLANSQHVLVGRWTAGGAGKTVALNYDGTDASPTAHTRDIGTVDRVDIGDSYTATTSATGFLGPLILSPKYKSDAWVSAIQANSGAAYSDPVTLLREFMEVGDVIYPLGADSVGYRRVEGSPPFSMSDLVVFDGNSLTVGVGSTIGVNDYPTQTMALLGGSWEKQNVGIGGLDGTRMVANGANIDVKYSTSRRTPRNICVFWEGTNDMNTTYNLTPAQAHANYIAYGQARRATGFKVVALTILPSTSAARPDWETKRGALNTLIRDNWESYADALADVAADVTIGEAGDSDNVTYYADGTHMMAAGYAIVAGIVKTAIEGLL